MAGRRTEPALPSHLVGPLLELLRTRGVDPAPLLARFGLQRDAVGATEVPIGPRELGRLLDDAAQLLDEPHLGLLLPAALRFNTYQLPELAARASSTLREALERMVQYAPLIHSAVVFALEQQDELARFTHRVAGHPRGVGRPLHEYAVAAMVHHARARTQAEFQAKEVHFIHARPPSLEVLQAHFPGAALRFGQLENAIVFDARWLEQVQVTADPRLLGTVDAFARDALSRQLARDGEFTDRVRELLRQQLADGDLRVRALARELHMSVRTLQRRLEEDGHTFASVLDGVRSDVARALVGAGQIPLSDVATRLGFSEFATFSRAFKRWYAVPPGAYRTQQRTQ